MVQYQRSDRDLGGRAIKGAAFIAGARLIVRGISLINIVILARLLTPEDFGLAALAFAALALVQVFSDMRVTDGLLALDDLTPAHLDTAFTMQLIRGLVTGALMLIFAGPIAAALGSQQLVPVIQVLAALMLIDALRNPGYFMFQRNVDFSREFLRDSISAVIASAVTIVLAILLESYWALIAGALVQRILQTLLTYFRISHRPRLTLRYWRAFIGFGAWLTFTGILHELIDFAPRVLIGRLLSPAAVGLFTVGRDTSALATEELMAPLQRVLFPSFSAMKHDVARLRQAIVTANSVLLAVALPIGFGIALIAPEIVLILLGQQWLDSIFVLQWLAPIFAINIGVAAATALMMALRKVRAIFLRALIFALVTWPAIYIGIRMDGLQGAVIAVALSMLPNLIVNIVALRQFAGVSMTKLLLAPWRAYAAVAAMSAMLLLVPRSSNLGRDPFTTLIDVAPIIALAAIIYTAVHAALWVLSGRPQDVETYALTMLRNVRRRISQE